MKKASRHIKRHKLFYLLVLFTFVWFLGAFSFKFSCPIFSGVFGATDNLENVFSPVGTFFSGLAAGGAIYAIILQAKIFENQKFENNFYNMLTILALKRDQMHAEHIDQEGNIKEVFGLYAFKALHQKLESIVTHYFSTLTPSHSQYINDTLQNEMDNIFSSLRHNENSQHFILLYDLFFESTDYCLEHYFRHLYHIFKNIDENVHDKNDRKKYFSIARAQLSPYEYALFYYNGLANKDPHPDGTPKLKKLIEHNCLLHNHTASLLFEQGEAGSYTDTAFDHDC